MTPYKDTILYLEGIIVILESLENKQDQNLTIGIVSDVHKTIGELVTKLHLLQ